MATKEFVDVRTDNPKVPADTDVLCGQEPAGGPGSQIGFTKAELLQALQAEVDLNTAKETNATHTGDVTGATALTIANDAVSNAKLANMGTQTLKGRSSAGTGDPQDLTAAQARALLNVEDGSEANQSDAEIKTQYENNANTNAFTDAEQAAVAANSAKVSADGSIDTHSDVDTTTAAPNSGDVLEWNGSDWVPAAPSGGGAGTYNEIEKDSASQSVGRAKIDFRDTGDATVTVTDDPANDRTIVSIDATAGGGGGGTQKGTPFVVGDLLQVESAAGDGTIQTAGVQTTSFATAAQGALADTALQAVVADTAPVLGGDLELAGFGLYEDYTATAGNTFAAGEVGYMVAAGTITKAQANAEAAVSGLMVMAMEAITAGTPGKFCRLGDVKGLAGLTAGSKYFVSATTAGGIVNTQPTGSSQFVRLIGYARSATTFVFQPSETWIELVA